MNKHHYTLYLLALGAFVTGTSELVVSGIIHVISLELNRSIALAGQLVTTFSLASAIGTPIVIALTSRMRRKKLLIGSLLLFLLGCLLSVISHHIYLLMLSRIVLGISAGVYLVVTLGLAAKLVPAEKLGNAIGTIVLGFSAALILGVPFGMAISEWLNWRSVFVLLGVLCLPILIMISRRIPDAADNAQVPFGKQLKVAGSLVIISGFAITLFKESGNSVLYTYLVPYMQNVVQIDASFSSLIMLALGIIGAIGARFSGYGVDRWGSSRVLFVSLIAAAATMMILPFASSHPLISLFGIFLIIFALFVSGPATQSYFIQTVGESSNLVLSLNTSVIHLGLAAGSGIGGIVLDQAATLFYHPWTGGLILFLGLVAAWISFTAGRPRRKRISRLEKDFA